MVTEIQKPIAANTFEECMSQEIDALTEKDPDMKDPQKTAIALNVCRKKFPQSSKAHILRLMEKRPQESSESLEPLIKAVKKSLNRYELIQYSVLLREEGLSTQEVASMIKYKSSWVKKYVNPIFKAVTELESLEIEDLSEVTKDGEIRKTLMKATVTNIDEEKREFQAYATAEVVDSEDEIIEAKGVVDIMPTYMERGGILLYGHSNRHVGRVLKWKAQDKAVSTKNVPAVWIHGKVFNHYHIDDEAWADVKRAEETGRPFLSIGATPIQDRYDCDGDKCRRVVEKEQLYEITITELGKGSQGANPEATLERTIEKNQSVALLLSDLYKSVVSTGAEEFASLTNAGLDEIKASEIIIEDVLRSMETTKVNLDTERVQMWRNGVMMGVISRKEAEELVASGKYKVITGQAISDMKSTSKDRTEMKEEKTEKEDPIQEPDEEKADFMKDLSAMLKEMHTMLKTLTAGKAAPPEDEEAPPPPEEQPEVPEEKTDQSADSQDEALTLSKEQFLALAKAKGFQVVETASPSVANSREQLTKNVPQIAKGLPTQEELSEAMRNSRDGGLTRLSEKYGFK